MLSSKPFFNDIRAILQRARRKAYTAVNFVMVEAYWQIGKRIVQEEQKGEACTEYGKQLIKELSKQLSAEFGRGFAEAANYFTFYFFFIVSSLPPSPICIFNRAAATSNEV